MADQIGLFGMNLERQAEMLLHVLDFILRLLENSIA
jgi:hypothetical protein